MNASVQHRTLSIALAPCAPQVFSAWRQWHHTTRHLTEQLAARQRSRTLQCCLSEWRVRSAHWQVKRAHGCKAARHWHSRLLRRTWHQLQLTVHASQDALVTVSQRKKARILHAWRTACLARRSLQRVLLLTAVTREQRTVRRAFGGWKAAVHDAHAAEAHAAALWANSQQHTVRSCWQLWSDLVASTQHRQGAADHMTSMRQQLLLSDSFQSWMQIVHWKQHAVALSLQLSAARHKRQIGSIWAVWRQKCVVPQAVTARCECLQHRHLCTRGLRAWRSALEHAR